MKIKVKTIRNSIISLLVIITIVLNSSYAYTLVSDIYALVSLLACSAILFVVWGFKKKTFSKRTFISNPITLLGIFVLFSLIIHFDFNSLGSYVHQALVLLLAALIYSDVDPKIFARVFVRMMLWISIIAIIVWILVNVFGIALPLPVMRGSSGGFYSEYYNGIIVFMNTFFTNKLMGVFWEPGIYSSTAILGLLFLDYYEEKHRKAISIVFIAGIILSFSTAGYILLFAYLIYVAVKDKSGFLTVVSSIIVSILVFIMVLFSNEIIIYLSNLMPGVFGKITYDNFSMSTRTMGPIVDLRIFAKSSLFGVGMKQYVEMWPTVARLLSVESRTSTITYFLANFGIIGILYLVGIIKVFSGQHSISLAAKVIVFLIIVSIVSKEPNYFNLLTTICILYLGSVSMNTDWTGQEKCSQETIEE